LVRAGITARPPPGKKLQQCLIRPANDRFQRLGLGATYSTTYYEPFRIARIFVTMD
jgi:hypothetical protein